MTAIEPPSDNTPGELTRTLTGVVEECEHLLRRLEVSKKDDFVPDLQKIRNAGFQFGELLGRVTESGPKSTASGFTLRSSEELHQLRTPLNHIIGYCELLLEDANDAGEHEIVTELESIHMGGKRLLSLLGRCPLH